MTLRVLLLSAEFGSGHFAAAGAIAALCREIAPGAVAEPVQVRSPVLTLLSRAYLAVIGWSPDLYRRLYQMEVGRGLRALVRLIYGRKVRQEIARINPDVIVGTQPFPAAVAAYMRTSGQLTAPVIMAMTDFAPHGLWLYEGIDCYCVASEQARDALIRLKIAPERIVVTGVAIRPEFAETPGATRRRSEADPIRRVLVMGGGLGLGPIIEAVASLAALPHPNLQITVVCGQNRALEQGARQRFSGDSRIRVLGFTNRVADLMRESDLLVTKPGGITCSEALATGLPMLLLTPLPGHEEENAAYLTQTGAAWITDAHQTGQSAAAMLFDTPQVLTAMRERARLAGRPRSAAAIAAEVVSRPAPSSRLTATGT